jgi:hypothetical protein
MLYAPAAVAIVFLLLRLALQPVMLKGCACASTTCDAHAMCSCCLTLAFLLCLPHQFEDPAPGLQRLREKLELDMAAACPWLTQVQVITIMLLQ